MQNPKSTFEPIAGTGATTPLRGRSRPSSTKSRRNSLSRVHSARIFDDHTHYSPTRSPNEESSEIDVSPSTSSSTHDLEKQETQELANPETEVQYGIADERDFVTGEEEIEERRSRSRGRSLKRDPTVVDWDGENDPLNPKNWSLGRKWAATFVVSAFTFLSPTSSSMVAPALSRVAADLHINSEVESALVLSIFVLAYAIGPLFLGPLSEVYGRVRVIQGANLFFLAWNIGCGFAQTSGQMLAFRFLAGLGGSAPLAIGGGILSDTWTADQRGMAISVYSLMPLLGPAIGPIAGGWIALKTTWRWCFWSTSILTGLIQIMGFFFLQETYAPTLLRKKAARMRKETGDERLHTQYDSEKKISKVLGVALKRPFVLLGTQVIIQIIAVYMAYLYGLMYLVLSTFPGLWTNVYHENAGIGGLNYISLGIGFFGGTFHSQQLTSSSY